MDDFDSGSSCQTIRQAPGSRMGEVLTNGEPCGVLYLGLPLPYMDIYNWIGMYSVAGVHLGRHGRLVGRIGT